MKTVRRWPYAVALALDLLVSAIFWGAPGETISARLARGKGLDRLACRVLDAVVLLLFRQPHHCELALVAFNARDQAASFRSG